MDEIINEIESAKSDKAELAALNSTSKVSVWGAIRDAIAFVIYSLYNFFELYKVELSAIADTGYFGTLAWYSNKIKEFQYGYSLELVGDKFLYETVDEGAKIIRQVAIETLGRVMNIKLATLIDGQLAPLNSDQKQAAVSYIRQISFPGVFLNVVSQDADILSLHYKIYYNAVYGQLTTEALIKSALENYLQNLVFNGRFDVAESIDAIQSVKGIKSPYLISASGRAYNVQSADALHFTESYASQSGYMNIESLTLEMIPV